MAEKVKKKTLFTLKRWHSQKSEVANPKPVQSNQSNASPVFNRVPQVSRSSHVEAKARPRMSASGLSDLVQCTLCLEVLHNPKMLPCQHTFCLACLSVYIADMAVISCPLCGTRIQILGSNFIEKLPSNLYIDSLLHLVGKSSSDPKLNTPPTTPVNGIQSAAKTVELLAAGTRCTNCQTVCDYSDVTSCQHCKLNFCKICWSQHLDDMRTQVASIVKQLDAASNRLEHKIEHYKDRCERILQQIETAADEKINEILDTKDKLLKEATELQKSGDMTALALMTSLNDAMSVASEATAGEGNDDKEQVLTFINLHQNTLQILKDVTKWDTENFVFDKENFRIELDAATPVDAESDYPLPDLARQNEPLESEDSLVMHYRSRNFVPHYVWRKITRPCGVGVSPWSNNLFICGMDTHSVLVMERGQGKIVGRLASDEMLCPVHIAFMKSLGEIYVTDKWKHCVHVFSREGEYVRSLGQKGSRPGSFRSPEGIATDNAQLLVYVVDTGNDRVQVITPEGKFVDVFGVGAKSLPKQSSTIWETKEVMCTELSSPTGVAVTKDRVIVLDSGNRRVKVYNKQDKNKIVEFGSVGQRKGQFRQPEVLAVDPMGLILVGDSGNCRVQVFKPNGQLVRVFGGLGTAPGKFGWISGIHVTKQMDIIISDTKNHNVNFF